MSQWRQLCVQFPWAVVYRHHDFIGESTTISCQENSTCSIYCRGLDTTNDRQCYRSRITCPSESGDCSVECSGYRSCLSSTIVGGRGRECLSCSGASSCYDATITLPNIDTASLSCTGGSTCQNSRITCPNNNNCTIHCDGLYSCNNARVTCPTGDHSCNILCTDPLSCQGLSITNTHNVYLQCCGGLSCTGTTVTPSSTECPYIH